MNFELLNAMDLQFLLVLGIVLVAAVYAGRVFLRQFVESEDGSGPGCCPGGCPALSRTALPAAGPSSASGDGGPSSAFIDLSGEVLPGRPRR